MSSVDDLTFPAGALSSFGAVQAWDNVIGAPDLRGNLETIPRRTGKTDVALVADARDMGVRMLLWGTTRDAWANSQRALSQAVWSPQAAQSVQRVITYPTGNVTHVGSVRYVSGLAPEMLSERHGRITLRFVLLDGYWYDTAATTIAPGTVTIPGDAYTRRMTITLPGAGTLTNSTLGVSVTVTVAATLDVEAFTASAGIDTQTWSGDDYFFVLAPGSNTITWSGAAGATVAYKAAHL